MNKLKIKLNPKDFFLGRKGPWPQPSPNHPWGEASAVIHLPLRERIDWWTFIGSRYVATLGLTPYYFVKAALKPGLKHVSNERFEWFINETMLSKFICKTLDEKDKHIFKEQIRANKDWCIVDLEAVRVIEARDGIYASGTKTLLYKEAERFKIECIYVDDSNEIFYPEDGDAWELAKYYVLQGGALCATLVSHPNQHFPNDSINAITKTSLPKDHLLFKLLYPHLRFTLPLENAVLNYKSSLLQDKWWMVYAPYPGTPEGLRDLLVEGYKGIKGNASYPPFSFPMKEPNLETKYGVYLRTYYRVFRKFVDKIIVDIPKDDFWTKKWAGYINKHVPDFPCEDSIFKDDTLARAVTSFLFSVTVGHSVDHYNYGSLDKREIPLCIRQEPPKKGIKLMDRSKLCSPIELMKYYMADSLFFSPTTVTKLIDTRYNLSKAEHKSAIKEFKKDLREAERELINQGVHYMPLKKIAASIQF